MANWIKSFYAKEGNNPRHPADIRLLPDELDVGVISADCEFEPKFFQLVTLQFLTFFSYHRV